MTTASLDKPTFVALLDELIPARNECLPGAGSLGIGDAIEARLGEAISVVASGLAALDEKARELGLSGSVDLAQSERASVVREVAEVVPGLVEVLMFHAYGRYYANPRVVVALGMKADPPFPGGYPLEQGNLGLLDSVRRRGIYREAGDGRVAFAVVISWPMPHRDDVGVARPTDHLCGCPFRPDIISL